jgi:hypothetical protein
MVQAKAKQLNRVLYRHRWNKIEEWVESLDELADLSEDEIADLARLTANDDDINTDDE